MWVRSAIYLNQVLGWFWKDILVHPLLRLTPITTFDLDLATLPTVIMASWHDRTVTNQHLLPYVDSATAPPDVKVALQTLPFERNIFKVSLFQITNTKVYDLVQSTVEAKINLMQLLANSSVFFKPFMALLASSWSDGRKIRSSEWQTVVLRTAAMLDAPYEWDVNEPVARVFGFTEEQFAALRNIDQPLSASIFTSRQCLIARLIGDLSHKNKVDLNLMLESKAVFSDEEIAEIMFLHGIYGFLARFMNSARIDFDEPIPGLLDILRKYNADAIEKEKVAEE